MFLEKTRSFCSFQVTRFVVGNLFIKIKSSLILNKVLTELCLYIIRDLFRVPPAHFMLVNVY